MTLFICLIKKRLLEVKCLGSLETQFPCSKTNTFSLLYKDKAGRVQIGMKKTHGKLLWLWLTCLTDDLIEMNPKWLGTLEGEITHLFH
jgi:hypothetical protein